MAYYQPKETIRGQSNFEEPGLTGFYTARDYLSWTYAGLRELIRGRVYEMSPAPSSYHQKVLGKLYLAFNKGPLGKGCEVWLSPVDVFFFHPGEDPMETRNVVQPDLFILCDSSKMEKRGCMGAPDFALEILSPSTSKKDASEKLTLYEEYGVREYWMVSIPDRLVIVNLLNDKGFYETQKPVVEDKLLAPRDFPKLEIDLNQIFTGITTE